eukprot:950236-Prymnesium_polylepis.1
MLSALLAPAAAKDATDEHTLVVGGLESLSVGGDGESLKALVPNGDLVCGVSLAHGESVTLIDAALRLTLAGSDDYAFIQRVRETLDDAAALCSVLQVTLTETQAGQRSWLNATAIQEIYNVGQQRLQAIEQASEACSQSLQQEIASLSPSARAAATSHHSR